MFGYSKAEMVGRMPSLLAPSDVGVDYTRAMLEGVKERGRWTGEVPFARKDGSEGIADTVVVPLSDDFGRRIAALGVCHDVTDRKNLEELKKTRETHS
jgi:PAS domain S-box-containing protein